MNRELLDFYREHVEEVLLPFWIRALDHKHGGIYTCFNNTGDELVITDKYTWSHSRWIKRDSTTGRIMDVKSDSKPFKGVRRENE